MDFFLRKIIVYYLVYKINLFIFVVNKVIDYFFSLCSLFYKPFYKGGCYEIN